MLVGAQELYPQVVRSEAQSRPGRLFSEGRRMIHPATVRDDQYSLTSLDWSPTSQKYRGSPNHEVSLITSWETVIQEQWVNKVNCKSLSFRHLYSQGTFYWKREILFCVNTAHKPFGFEIFPGVCIHGNYYQAFFFSTDWMIRVNAWPVIQGGESASLVSCRSNSDQGPEEVTGEDAATDALVSAHS